GEGDNDTILSANRNDVVDGGDGFDTLQAQAGTFVVRNGERVTVNVPLGSPTNADRGSAVNAGFRYLRAYGFNPTVGVVLTDDTWGLSPTSLRNLLRTFKPDVTLETDSSIQRLLDLVGSGRPVITQMTFAPHGHLHHRYVLVNGFDLAAQTI